MTVRTAEGVGREEQGAAGSGGAIARNAAHLIMGQAATTALAVLLSAALARALGASEFGLFFVVTSMAQFAFVVVEWGQLQYVVREVARAPDRAGDLLGGALTLRIAGTALLTCLAVLFAWAAGYDLRTRTLLAMLMGGMLPFVLAQGLMLIYRGYERMEFEAATSVLNRASTLALVLVALALGMGLPGAFLAQGIGGTVALAVGFVFLRKMRIPKIQVRPETLKQIVFGGAPLVMMSVTIASQGAIEALILSKFGSADGIGWFGAAKTVLGTLIAPATILASSAYPRLSRAADDPSRFREELKVAIRPVLALAVLAAVGTYLFAPGAISLIYGASSFGPAATILQVFAPGLLLLFLDILLGSAVLAVGRPLPLATAKVVTVAASAGLAVWLVPLFQAKVGNGGIGAALAFTTCELIMFLTAIALLPKRTLRWGMAMDGVRALVAGAVTMCVFLTLPSLSLFVGAPLCVLAFTISATGTGLIRRNELRWALSKAFRRVGKNA